MTDEPLYEKMNPPGIGAMMFDLLGALPTGAVLLFMVFGEQPVTAPTPLIIAFLALGGLFWALLEGAGTRVYADRIEHVHKLVKRRLVHFSDLVEASFVEMALSHPNVVLRTSGGRKLSWSVRGSRSDADPLFLKALHDALIGWGFPVESRNLEGKTPFAAWGLGLSR